MKNYVEINRNAWNHKTAIHVDSEFYDNDAFLKGKNTLKDIELNLLGDIKGKSVLHLQCHFGQDSISMARMGAKVTGVDLSDKAIDKAKEFVKFTGIDAEFICCDIYDLPDFLDKKFDIVFTSYGVIGWLPDLERWANIVSRYLKPEGRFIFVEFHPLVWVFDDDFTKIQYSYFNTETIVEEISGSYADREASITYKTVSWNHSTSEILNNLIKEGIDIKSFNEYDYSPYNCFKDMVKVKEDVYRIKSVGDKLPMIFALEGIKK
ncbi:MAG: class I SAM-dependent methyltransferase [Dysgonomonas sp.]|nr:class I SAM-dependent methyltransferase [Dysgonomonas sp.]